MKLKKLPCKPLHNLSSLWPPSTGHSSMFVHREFWFLKEDRLSGSSHVGQRVGYYGSREGLLDGLDPGVPCSGPQSCLTLCYSTDCSPPGSSVHGLFQARILEWLSFPPPGNLPNPGIETASSALLANSFPLSHQGSPLDPGGVTYRDDGSSGQTELCTLIGWSREAWEVSKSELLLPPQYR